jgi:hypothetical protein
VHPLQLVVQVHRQQQVLAAAGVVVAGPPGLLRVVPVVPVVVVPVVVVVALVPQAQAVLAVLVAVAKLLLKSGAKPNYAQSSRNSTRH